MIPVSTPFSSTGKCTIPEVPEAVILSPPCTRILPSFLRVLSVRFIPLKSKTASSSICIELEALSFLPSPSASKSKEISSFAKSKSSVKTGYFSEATVGIFTSAYFVGTEEGNQFSVEFHLVGFAESAPVQTYSCPAKIQLVLPVPSTL